MSTRPGGTARWPEHLPVGAVRVGRSSTHYDQTIRFYRDLVGLPVLDSFAASYGEDGTIFGLPDTSVQLEVVRSAAPIVGADRLDMLVFYLPDAQPRSGWSPGWRWGCGADVAASLLAGERRRDLPGSGRAPGRVRVVGLRARPDLTEPHEPVTGSDTPSNVTPRSQRSEETAGSAGCSPPAAHRASRVAQLGSERNATE
jgi:hypothetical protein